MPRIWTYLYTTSESPLSLMDDELEGADSPAVMAGYGVGLPISRLYARYFGGDLNITSMEVGLLPRTGLIANHVVMGVGPTPWKLCRGMGQTLSFICTV